VEWNIMKAYQYYPIFVWMLPFGSAFTTNNVVIESKKSFYTNLALSSSSSNNDEGIDVSDLGLTMDDLNAPLPSELLGGIQTTGYQSTSRISNDDACMWTESPTTMKVVLTIPGLRGQPAMCLSTLTSINTLSITAFGRVVWSCILREEVQPDTATFEAKEASSSSSMIPVVEYEVNKAEPGKRWGGFILQIGEDSIL
jgi:hypothetical protein